MAFPGIPNPQDAGIPAPPAASTDLLRGALEPLDNPVEASLRTLVEYGSLLLAANTRTNLTGAKDWGTLVEAHLLDCIYAARFLPAKAQCLLDWGSGGGLPGLVWAGIFPHRYFHLCERNRKKADFLKAACSALKLSQVQVVAQQGEEVIRHLQPRADLIVARAVEPLPRFLRRLARPSLPPLHLFLMAGPSWERDWSEQQELHDHWQLLESNCYELGPERGSRFTLYFRRRNAS